MKVRFSVLEPEAKRGSYDVPLPIVIGRGAEAKFRIQQDRISRKHCEVFDRDGEVFVRDLGSTNGTFLDGEPIAASVKTPLPAGSVLRIGTIALQVDYGSSERTAVVAAADGAAADDATMSFTPAAEEVNPAEVGISAPGAEAEAVEESVEEPAEAEAVEELADAPPLDPAAFDTTQKAPTGDFGDLEVVEEKPADPFAAGLVAEPAEESPAAGSFDFLANEPAADEADEGLDDFFKGLK